MSRRPHPSQRFMTHAHDASRNDVLQTETSKSLRQVLRAARATGALALAGRRLRTARRIVCPDARRLGRGREVLGDRGVEILRLFAQ